MQSNRQLVIVLAACFAIPIVAMVLWMLGESDQGPEAAYSTVRAVSPEDKRLLDALEKAKSAESRPSAEVEAERIIETHMKALEDAPDSPDSPARWSAMGNLYMQKFMNFEEAARCYETLLDRYPEWEMAPGIYPLLASCYEQLGDTKNETIIYQQMMEKLSPESKEYEFAKFKLGIR